MPKPRQVLVFLSCFCLLNIYRDASIIMRGSVVDDYNKVAWTNMLGGFIAERRNKTTAAATGFLRGLSSSSSSAAAGATGAGGNSHKNISSAAEEVKATDPPVDPCTKELTTDEKIWIGMAAWNDKGLLHRALRSVEAQADTAGYAHIKVVVFEDYSDSNMFTKSDKDKHGKTAGVQIIYLRENEKKQRGSAFGKDRLFGYIGSHALPHEYVLLLDGDDTFPDSTTLQYIHEELMLHKPWFAWGRHNGKYSEQCSDLADASAWKDVRHAVWSFCHPRMFQSHLLSHLQVTDLQRQDGSWLQKATDRGFIYKFLELAGPARSRYMGVDRALYNYTFSNNNGLKLFSKEVINGDKQYMIDSKPSTRGADRVHVVACVFNRRNTEAFLTALFQSKVPADSTAHPVQFHFHICNNKPDRQDELEVLAESLAVKFGDQQHTITVHNMAYNIGGLARFMVAETLMSQVFVDYVIMLDDDQYVFNTTLAEIYEQREPKTYKAWHGKNWMDLDRSSSSSSSSRRIAASGAGLEDTTATTKNKKKKDFWEPFERISTANPANGHLEQPEVKTWQYGATGMSIIDANIFRIQQLFEDTQSYMFVEDIWLSYIVQTAGWKIKRLHVTFEQEQQQQNDNDDPSGTDHHYRLGSRSSLSSSSSLSSFFSQSMKDVKNEVFEKVGYLGCTPYRKENRWGPCDSIWAGKLSAVCRATPLF